MGSTQRSTSTGPVTSVADQTSIAAYSIIAASLGHSPVHREKIGSAYTTESGQRVPAHTLHAYDCSCGYKARVWMASQERAFAIFRRNIPHRERGGRA